MVYQLLFGSLLAQMHNISSRNSSLEVYYERNNSQQTEMSPSRLYTINHANISYYTRQNSIHDYFSSHIRPLISSDVPSNILHAMNTRILGPCPERLSLPPKKNAEKTPQGN